MTLRELHRRLKLPLKCESGYLFFGLVYGTAIACFTLGYLWCATW